jgi:DNA-binding HxlR family transcriptional regulator
VFLTPGGAASTAELDEIVLSVIGRVADKWTMGVLEVLNQNGTVRFTRIARLVGGISQRMLTKTLRQMEHDGFVMRKVYPEVPPKVEYTLTELGNSLCAAFCGVWTWAEEHQAEFARLRAGRRPKG